MPLLFKRSKVAVTADDAKSKQKSTPTKSSSTLKRNSRSDKDGNDIKSVFSGDESLLQLHEETAELLRLVKTPAKSVLKSPNATRQQQSKSSIGSNGANGTTPSKARMTIEVLDDDDDDDESNQLPMAEVKTTGSGSNPSQATASLASPSMAQSTDGGAGSTMDPFAFNTEESRVRRASDTFYPDTSPSKKAMDKQLRDFTNEQLRLKSIDRNEQLRNERRHQEIEHHQLNKLQSRLETSTIKIQARSRGYLARKHYQQAKSQAVVVSVDQWHEVRDVERGEVWYYNARTGQSQWEPPPSFVPFSVPASVVSTAIGGEGLGTSGSLSELPLIKGAGDGSFRSTLRRSSSATGNGLDMLPPLSPTTSSDCSSARSNANEQLHHQSRPNSGNNNNSVKKASMAPNKTTESLPVLIHSQQQPQYVTSVPNPWECDSVMGGSDESLCASQRTRLGDDDDEDGDTESCYDESNFRRRSSTLDKRSEGCDEDQGDGDGDPDNGDWQVNDSLFLADGSRNSKLRDTIRNALYVSKFDSISTLIASNVVLRKRPVRARKQQHDTTEDWVGHQHQGNQRSGPCSTNKKTGVGSREIVLGKRDAPMFVAMLTDDKRQPNSVSSVKSPKSVTKTSSKPSRRGFGSQQQQQHTIANPLTSPPRVRDLVDPGFHIEDHPGKKPQRRQPIATNNDDDDGDTAVGDPSKKASTSAVCFNCWSSSNGRYCEIHRDPNESRKIKASESALMCANWNLDQLRRKYRAEEIQEMFMKQNASLRYDKKLKQYVTVVECKHPIYRTVEQLLLNWNKTMRRKLHTRAWFRSFMEQLRAGRVPKADSKTPGLLKLKNTIQNNRWCTSYSDSVREFHPKAPVTLKNISGQATHIPDVIMIHPANPQLRNWVLKTEFTKPVELYKPRVYELPPRRCVPMPSPSFLEDIPLPVPNVHIDCGHIASWLERLCARISEASLNKAVLQINACSPPPGFNDARRTKHVTPLTVMFATFGRKPTQGNVAVGGLSAELLIHMLVTTYIPAQFGNFIVFDRRAIAPALIKDHDALYTCQAILASDPIYVFRSLEHALNVRRPPCIILATRAYEFETEVLAIENRRFPANRPEQTGEELANGFRTFWLVDAFQVPDDVESVLVQPNSEILSPNSTSMNTTLTTKVDRFYPFCIPTTKENTPIEFIHLLWIGQSSRNQPQVFTTLGAQQPGEFMKNSDPNGALGVCTSVIYRSWAFMQSNSFEEFVTDDGVAYWYDKQSGETFWTRPIVPVERYRGKDGDIDGVVADGEGEVATLGVGAGLELAGETGKESGLYPQQIVRKYMTKSMEAPEEKDKRMRHVTASAKKHDIVIDLSERTGSGGGSRRLSSGAPVGSRKELARIQVPQLTFKKGETRPSGGDSRSHSLVKQQQQSGGSSTNQAQGAQHNSKSNSSSSSMGIVESSALDLNTKQLIDSITQALGQGGNGIGGAGGGGAVNMLQLGIGLGMGLGLRAQQQQGFQVPSARLASSRTTDRSRGMRNTRGFSTNNDTNANGGLLDLGQHDEGDEDDDGMSTSRSYESSDSGGSFSARSTVSTAATVDISLPPDEQELNGRGDDSLEHGRIPRPGILEKKPGYQTHVPPGEGKSWIHKPIDASGESQTAVPGFAGALHQRVACLPKDFVEAVTSTKTCKMQANYLPVIKNTNEPRSVGLVRPRAVLEEWLPLQYSPWSAGRAVFGTQFISDLMQRPELASQVNSTAGPGAGVKNVGVHVEQREKVTQAMKEAQQLEEIFSHCRHGKYDDVELSLNNPDWTLHIDAKDAMGNTLLSVACQNNNKRIAKLCMRRGADINTQNLNGQTVLHYCHEYGFHDLMDYLMEKGARDDIVNADGLTCYEGLNKEAVDTL